LIPRPFVREMYLLKTLGRIRLTDGDDREVDRLLQQPKRLALLAYLASPTPGTWHRRDVLLEVFWPELDAERARGALRNALHVLRRDVGAGVIRTRGDDEVSVDPALFATDAATMEHEADSGRLEEAFDRYEGDYLRGLYIKDSESFDRWLDDEKRRLLTFAKKAGLGGAGTREQSGDVRSAIELVERVASLDPHDESVVRRLIGLLDRSGDRARALAAYEQFSARLAEDLGAEASAETIAQVEAIRLRRVLGPDLPTGMTLPARAAAPPVTPVPPNTQRSRRLLVRSIAAAAVVVVTFSTPVAIRARGADHAPLLVILPMENTVADSLSYLGLAINGEVARRLRGIGGLKTVGSLYDDWPKAVRNDLPRIGRQFGWHVALRTTLSGANGSLVLSAELVDIDANTAQRVAEYALAPDSIRDVSSRLAAAVAGSLFRAVLPMAPHADPKHFPTSESFRLAMCGHSHCEAMGRGGLYQHGPQGPAASFYRRAIDLDPTNARAWAGLSSVYTVAAIGGLEDWGDATALAELAGQQAIRLDSLEGTPWANFAALRVSQSHRMSDGDSLFARATALDPGNPELYLIKATLYRAAWQWDKARDAFRMARQLDPFSPGLLERASALELCAGRPQEALAIAKAALDPTRPSQRSLLARILPRLGRWDEAVAELRSADSSLTNPADPTSGLTGEAAYWAIRNRDGRANLARVEKMTLTSRVRDARLASAYIGAGDLDRGMSLLEQAIKSGAPGDKLPCAPDFDRVRDTPRFKAILALVPRWDR
jgi:DNA-binding SARP family transcriptional activator